jgi:hypothetical protein
MTLPISDLFTPATAPQWLALLLANADTLQLPTTSWQSGGITRTILAMMSNMLGQEDGIISTMAQGGFLDYAATGTVTFTAANGETVTQPVTPDPSIPTQNPTGAPGWLDLLASSVYNVTRVGARRASGVLAIVNSSGNVYGPFTAGTYHVANPSSGAAYANVDSLTIAAATLVGAGISTASNTTPIVVTTNAAHGLTGSEIVYITGVVGNTAANGFWAISVTGLSSFQLVGSAGNGAYVSGGTVNVCTTVACQADLAGPAATSSPGTITQAVTTLAGVQVDNLVSFVGSAFESNIALAARCRLKLQSLSPNGPRGAYEYFALTAVDILAAETPPVALSAPVTRVLVQASATTGVVTTTVANASGAVPGVSNLGIIGATNATPIQITSAAAHGLATGDFVTISGVIGTTAANGTWTITNTGAATFTLNSSAGNGAYVGGGVIEGGDLGEVDRVIQANAVPDSVTAITRSATAFNVAVTATVTVPNASVAAYTSAVQNALATYFATLPIGGIAGLVQYNDVIGVLYAAGSVNGQVSYVQSIGSLLLNAGAVNLVYPSSSAVAQLSPAPIITVLGA